MTQADTLRTGPASWIAPLLVFAVLLLAFWFRAAPLALDPVRETNAASQFDTSRAIARLARILGDETPHPVDSDALDITRARLLSEIRSLGYVPEVMDQTACRSSISGTSIRCARVQNILFTAGPQTGPALILAAHYDSVDAAPGAGDDGIGLAVWLEVAHHLRETPPDRPVVFLFTDGEEAALLGAQAFVDADSYGRDVWRFINLEARGVTGPAMMFETSRPNSGVVGDWSKNGARPFSNSLMTAVYELLPNSTDLSVWLGAGHAGINIAISDGVAFYHTSRDSLAMLDHTSVQHMGDQALGATRAFLASQPAAEGELIYADILSRAFVTMPQGFGLLLLGLCVALAAALVVSPQRGANWKHIDWRAFAFAPAVIIGSGALAWATLFLLSTLRAEPAFWTGHPEWLHLAYFIGALLVSAIGLGWLAPRSRAETLFASGWFWFLATGAALSLVVPGIAMLFLLPGLVFVVLATAGRFLPVSPALIHVVPALAAIAVFFPMLHLLDVTMGLSLAPVLGATAGLVLATTPALVGGLTQGRAIVTGALVVGVVGASVLALQAPAYTVDKPLALNIVTHVDRDTGAAHIVASAPPRALPQPVADALPDMLDNIVPGFPLPLRGRAVDLRDSPSVGWFLDTDETTDDVRRIGLVVYAPDARSVRLRIPADAGVRAVRLDGAPQGVTVREPGSGPVIFDCVGRACDGGRIFIDLPAEPPAEDAAPWVVQGFWSILPREALAVVDARPDTALPIQTGDITIATRRIAPATLTIPPEETLQPLDP